MPLLTDARHLEARRRIASTTLAPLADALAAELSPLLAREPLIPAEKAQLTRIGGWCPRDGARLEFDPWSPREHRCPTCGAIETDEEHYRMWIMWYQLWLAERVVHGALLFALRGDRRHATFASALLARLAESYARYPNRDNALGPTRPFFSTYLESIWLLQLCIGLDLLELSDAATTAGVPASLGGEVRSRLIEPSRALIAEFDEGGSNRQVWNDAALLAAARLLDDADSAEWVIHGPSGVGTLLGSGLLEDGTWYEGENYHLFAHRGLWYGVTMAERAGLELPAALIARFQEGFATPFVSALPDLTLPSRRDSQYAISLRQWRFAEMCELGLARRDDARLVAALHELYTTGDGHGDLAAGEGAAGRGVPRAGNLARVGNRGIDRDDRSFVPRRDVGRDRSAADVERNLPASALTRADLGWRSLLHARAERPRTSRAEPPKSVLLDGQGLAILRPEGRRVYAALDYGHSGGGHGHPDRLNVLLADGSVRWLDDPGTGSYVDSSLHWYRSTLAHNAPLVDGRSQQRVHGELLAWESGEAASWVRATAAIAAGVRGVRTLIARDGYLVDVLEWEADREVAVDLPIHLDGELSIPDSRPDDEVEWHRESLAGGAGVEDGFRFLRDAERVQSSLPPVVELDARSGDARLHAFVHAARAEWWRALAPAAPGSGDARFHLIRQHGRVGRIVSVLSWRTELTGLEASGGGITVRLRSGAVDRHTPSDEGWRIERRIAERVEVIDLAGCRVPEPEADPAPRMRAPSVHRPVTVPSPSSADSWLRFTLGENEYRRSEASWIEAGAPSADVRIGIIDSHVAIDVSVHGTEARFAAANAMNPFDNEHPDIDGGGVQLYYGAGSLEGWMLVPEPAGEPGPGPERAHTEHESSREHATLTRPAQGSGAGAGVRVRAIAGYANANPPEAEFHDVSDGWKLRARVPLASLGATTGGAFRLGLIINTITPGRARREGQLVLGGAHGGWVYLRGDRHAPESFLTVTVDGPSEPIVPPSDV